MLRVFMEDKTLHSPLNDENHSRVVDIGCGTGIVTHRIASQFPNAEVFGLDISSVPKLRKTLKNEKFLVGNILTQDATEWLDEKGRPVFNSKDQVFDLTFSRFLMFGMMDWWGYIQKLFQVVKPGGWAEIQEIDPNMYGPDGKALPREGRFDAGLFNYLHSKGVDIFVIEKIPDLLRQAGFVDVQMVKYRVSMGDRFETDPARRRAGAWMLGNLKGILTLMSERAIPDVGAEEVQRWKDATNEQLDGSRDIYTQVLVMYAKKPA